MSYLNDIVNTSLKIYILKKIRYNLGFIHNKKFKKYKNKKKIIHMLTPRHGNMGDQAIVYATNKFLEEKFKDYELVEIYREDVYKYAKSIKAILNEDDIIVLIGGGNMGNLWVEEEIDRRFVIDKFKKNKIISMPQTISFTDDENGKNELQETKRIYNNHKNLTVIAREQKSLGIMKKEFYNSEVILNPDTVLYLSNIYTNRDKKSERIMTCLRNDKESVLGEKKSKLINDLNNNYSSVFNFDTVIDKVVTREIRKQELEAMFNEFLKSKVVITDRLHGMVFAAITKTPCIVTKSLDHKVTGTYDWIKNLNYIRLVENLEFEYIKELIDELSELKEIDDIDFNGSFKELAKKLNNK